MHFSGFVPVFRWAFPYTHSLEFIWAVDLKIISLHVSNQNANWNLLQIRTIEQTTKQFKKNNYVSKWLTKSISFTAAKYDLLGKLLCKIFTSDIFDTNSMMYYLGRLMKSLQYQEQEEWHWQLNIIITEIYKNTMTQYWCSDVFPQTWVMLTYLLSPTQRSLQRCLLSLCLSHRLSE